MFCKSTVFSEFRVNGPKLYGNCAFPQKFHIRKLGETAVFYTVVKDTYEPQQI